MAHFCKLDETNVVIETIVVANEVLLDENGIEQEQKGIDFLIEWSGGHLNWKQTSYNTQAGVHLLGGTPFRKNYATAGFLYDPIRDAFIPHKQFPSHTLNEETCRWVAPIPMPETEPGSGIVYHWDEDSYSWILTEPDE